MTKARRWRIRLTVAAEHDFQGILHWTEERFGGKQAKIYAETLIQAIEALTAGPQAAGARGREDISAGLMTLHVAREGRKGRHLVLYRASSEADLPVIEILRLLHDSMDLPRHIDPDEGEA